MLVSTIMLAYVSINSCSELLTFISGSKQRGIGPKGWRPKFFAEYEQSGSESLC